MRNETTPAWLDHPYDPATLTAMQRQGFHCVVCDRPWSRAVPVGHVHAPDGFQVFACDGACADLLAMSTAELQRLLTDVQAHIAYRASATGQAPEAQPADALARETRGRRGASG